VEKNGLFDPSIVHVNMEARGSEELSCEYTPFVLLGSSVDIGVGPK